MTTIDTSSLTCYEQVRIDPDTIVGSPGFYRAGKDTDGRWWFLRPDGRPFLYKGVCAACDGIAGKHYHKIYYERYGDDSQRFARDAFNVLDDLGFNAFGMWCFLRTPDAGYDHLGWPFIDYVHARECCAETRVSVGGTFTLTVDVFDPRWHQAFDRAIAAKAERHRDNPNLFGYYVENEPFWGQAVYRMEGGEDWPDDVTGQTWVKTPGSRPFRWGIDSWEGQERKGQKPKGTLLTAYLLLEDDRPGHRAAWDWLLARHGGSMAQVAADWGVAFDDIASFRRMVDEHGALACAAYGRDHEDFTRLFMEEFYRVTGETIRRHDPNHLRLGVRHCAGWPVHGPTVLGHYDSPAVRKHTDIFSMNMYSDNPTTTVDSYAAHFDMPMIIGEYSWGAWIYPQQTYPPEFQDDHEGWLRQEGVRRSAAMFAQPKLCGYTWFKWYCDNFDPDAPGLAVVSEDHEVNRFNAPMFRRFHAAMEDVHAGVRQVADL